MAKTVLTNCHVSIAGNDISDHVRSVALNYEAEEVDDTTMGDDTRSRLGGLKNWTLEVEVANDFAGSAEDSILFPLVGTQVAIVFRPDAGAVASDNPEYTGTALMTSYPPVGQATGELASASISLASASSLSRATS